ncbi:MAG: hypothetical protein RL148_3260 [Planctomycetota bacterium]|jgi:uncharacterized protein (TIGR04168 family)
MSKDVATLTIVGDVHRNWSTQDHRFVEQSGSALTLFVGDLGDEDPAIVREVAGIAAPKAVMLGNHDAWQSCSNKKVTDALHDSLEALGDDHLAYGVRDVHEARVSVVGARPFSWGGPSLRAAEVYDELYGFHTMRQSAVLIVEAARRAAYQDLVVLAHNGPLGLSDRSDEIYGKDFGKPGGDWGDRDLAIAIPRIRDLGFRIRAIVAGHMHHRLVHPRGAERIRFVRSGNMLVVNPAVVPRHRTSNAGENLSYFVRMQWREGACTGVEELWVGEDATVRSALPPRFVEREWLAPGEGQEG